MACNGTAADPSNFAAWEKSKNFHVKGEKNDDYNTQNINIESAWKNKYLQVIYKPITTSKTDLQDWLQDYCHERT